ncbi:ABC transporter permease [Nocardioides sp.]|jgi:ribose transport system permease protein/L-arabinose transport system permease protein|uniref:ABC transporter permease n=1 Tax=Nocardioides sp. TaxID=35761 RepID=UPI002BF44BB4|nr:ABC transporter permease [Nocardioides sp.]HVX53393.1 ABC transporter permease [Nocardioides sp.]
MTGEVSSSAEEVGDTTTPHEPPLSARILRRIGPANVGLVVALVVLCAAIRTQSDKIFLLGNIINIGVAVAILGVLAVAQMVVVISGGLDISIGSTTSLTTVVVAMALHHGVPTGLGVLIALGVGLAAGAVNGLIVIAMRINAIIVTLATFSGFAGIAYVLSKGLQIAVNGKFFLDLGTNKLAGIPYPVWVLAVFALLTHLFIRYTVAGRHIFAMGSNEAAARNTGISLARYRLGVYAYAGLAGGVAGLLSIASNGLGEATTAGADQGLTAITAALLGGAALTGGRGSIPGAVLGVILLGVLDNGLVLMNANPFYSQIVVGCLLIVAVGLQQSGVFDRMTSRARKARVS